ncbi:hypothetical protein [Streptomyces sp. NPDC047841]|uniref:hypothetical protein n=1 Tax=Streptomyces sp. NPDC047841 TaxID=3154708 RepID=UPI0034545B70
MGRLWRWVTAAGVTVAAFAVPALVCGRWALVPVVADTATRWAVACALGTAVAALAVLWGQSFAAAAAPTPPTATVAASGNRAVAVNGPVNGTITTGDRGTPAPAPGPRSASRQGPAPTPTTPESVVASGERSVALGGGFTGDIVTGDDRTSGPTP